MTFTYSGDPTSSATDEIRFMISDTDSTRPLLTDEEIAYIHAKWDALYGSTTLEAAVCCEIIAGKFAREVSVSADGVSVGLSELQGKYDALASSLRDQYKSEQAMAEPSFSGALFDLTWDDTIKPLMFGKGFMDNYLAGQQNYGDYDPSEQPGFYPDGTPGY
jgi:hypothetical protein